VDRLVADPKAFKIIYGALRENLIFTIHNADLHVLFVRFLTRMVGRAVCFACALRDYNDQILGDCGGSSEFRLWV
jgi:hypothetical protein